LLALVALLVSAPCVLAAPIFTATIGGVDPNGTRTVPYFTNSFSFGGQTYQYKMVGTNPFMSSTTTTVPTVIVPLRFVFADGTVFDPGATPASAAGSPIFQNSSFSSGNTQYGDAMRRAMFWRSLASSDYHVLLGQPQVLPTQTINVPKGQGVVVHAGDPIGPHALGVHAATDMGVVSDSWYDGAPVGKAKILQTGGVFAQLLNSLKPDPTTLPMILSRNVFLSGKPIPYGQYLTFGFHTADSVPFGTTVKGAARTSIWATYFDPYPAAELPGLGANTDILSHEVSEWLHDPFLYNFVPPWQSPLPLSAASYGCLDNLETADPVSEVTFQQDGYELQDEAFFSWFARQSPSIGINGQYTYLDTFGSPPPVC
jgi:hypothetical protein